MWIMNLPVLPLQSRVCQCVCPRQQSCRRRWGWSRTRGFPRLWCGWKLSSRRCPVPPSFSFLFLHFKYMHRGNDPVPPEIRAQVHQITLSHHRQLRIVTWAVTTMTRIVATTELKSSWFGRTSPPWSVLLWYAPGPSVAWDILWGQPLFKKEW